MPESQTSNETHLTLLKEVERLALEGNNQKQIAETLGFKTTFTLNNRLVKASQITGKPIPSFKQNRKGRKGQKRVEVVEVKRRGNGEAFGVDIPQEPLMRLGVKPGDKLKVSVRGKTVSSSSIPPFERKRFLLSIVAFVLQNRHPEYP